MKAFAVMGVFLALPVLIYGPHLSPPRHWGCGAKADVIPIAYGLPGLQAVKQAQQGKIYPGGCMVGRERWYCRKCESRW
jgi:hypothetical protein